MPVMSDFKGVLSQSDFKKMLGQIVFDEARLKEYVRKSIQIDTTHREVLGGIIENEEDPMQGEVHYYELSDLGIDAKGASSPIIVLPENFESDIYWGENAAGGYFGLGDMLFGSDGKARYDQINIFRELQKEMKETGRKAFAGAIKYAKMLRALKMEFEKNQQLGRDTEKDRYSYLMFTYAKTLSSILETFSICSYKIEAINTLIQYAVLFGRIPYGSKGKEEADALMKATGQGVGEYHVGRIAHYVLENDLAPFKGKIAPLYRAVAEANKFIHVEPDNALRKNIRTYFRRMHNCPPPRSPEAWKTFAEKHYVNRNGMG